MTIETDRLIAPESGDRGEEQVDRAIRPLSLIHISEPTRPY